MNVNNFFKFLKSERNVRRRKSKSENCLKLSLNWIFVFFVGLSLPHHNISSFNRQQTINKLMWPLNIFQQQQKARSRNNRKFIFTTLISLFIFIATLLLFKLIAHTTPDYQFCEWNFRWTCNLHKLQIAISFRLATMVICEDRAIDANDGDESESRRYCTTLRVLIHSSLTSHHID